MLPSELPRLDGFSAEYFYIINLDREVLTMNHSIHWKLGNIPRQDDLWLHAITDSIYPDKPTISPDVCPEEHMASLALELPDRNEKIDYDFRIVTPRTNIGEARKAFLTHVLARVLIEYKNEVIRFGKEWAPDSFPFRELTFSLVSIASGQAKLFSFPPKPSKSKYLPRSIGWLDEEWAGDSAPLMEFGSSCHRPGKPPGASPTETMYWLEDVLVSLTLVNDGEAITKAITWGIEQGRTNFQIVVLSLFEAAFAEVSFKDEKPFVQVSKPVDLSPLRADYCVSTHPRERPVLKPGMEIQQQPGELIMESNCAGTARKLRNHFPGLAALVNFFDVAASRCAASKSGIFPSELYGRILDFVDYDTWKACSIVSQELRCYCLLKYRLDDRMRIVGGPFVRLEPLDEEYPKELPDEEHIKVVLDEEHLQERLLSFDFENMKTGKVLTMKQIQGLPRYHYRTEDYKSMPLIGSGQRAALMVDVVVWFEPAEDVPVEADSDDEQS
jgi:hypothetical protein